MTPFKIVIAGYVKHDCNCNPNGVSIIYGVYIIVCSGLFVMFMCSFQPQPYNFPLSPFAKLNYVPTLI